VSLPDILNSRPDMLAAAVDYHQKGQFTSAARLYEQVLARDPQNADALHLIGVLRHQQGDHTAAAERIRDAIALRPSIPAYHANLAEAYRALGQFERAVGCCRSALKLWPDFPEAHCNLGLALQALGRHAEAAEHFRRALELRADFAAAHNSLGITLRELGQSEEALEHFRRAVELAPDYPPARTNLGQCLLDHNQAEEALIHCQEAVRLQPDLAAAHHNLGNALRGQGRYLEARAAYLEAIRLDAKLAISHAHLGLVLLQGGDLNDALVWLKQASQLEPENPDFWEFLADLYMEREEFTEALPYWEQALALAPERASVHSGLAWALHEEGRTVEATGHYREALRLKPDFAAARMSLGGLHEEEGELAEAEADFRQALRLQPGFALPHARLATLLRGKLSAVDQTALETRLADPQLADGPRARLLFALAHVQDARGDYAGAAECLRRANALSQEISLKKKRSYQPIEHERFVDKLLDVFGVEFFARMRGAGIDTRQPVFVFGLPRSGTTLVEQILASHSCVYGAGELRLARQTFETIPTILNCSEPALACVPTLDHATLTRLAERHLMAFCELVPDPVLTRDHKPRTKNRLIVDKMPDNYLYLGLLAAMFPEATFIHCRRDPRDVALSCWMTDFRSIRWANDPEHIASRFQQYFRLMQHWRAVLPVPLHEVVYEQLVEDFEPEARRLLAACGLEWEAACSRFHETARPVRTASATQVRQPLYRRGLARWKHYEQDLAELFAEVQKR
jgi:tetratricopeptide (TPR) repeat protein